jgi:hypothetical protein
VMVVTLTAEVSTAAAAARSDVRSAVSACSTCGSSVMTLASDGITALIWTWTSAQHTAP